MSYELAFDSPLANRMSWEPNELTWEWWKSDRKLSVFYDDAAGFTFLISWDNMGAVCMQEGPFTRSAGLKLWDWLTTGTRHTLAVGAGEL